MLKKAPPMFVVAMVALVLWVPLALSRYVFDLENYRSQFITLTSALATGGVLAVLAAMGELARRTRGPTRAWLIVPCVAMTIEALLVTGSSFFGMMMVGYLTIAQWVALLQWTASAAWLIGWLSFGAAGWRTQRRTAITVIALSLVCDTLPPVRDVIFTTLGEYAGFVLYLLVSPLRNLIALLLAGAIAERARPPARDHVAASRIAKLVAIAIAAFAALLLVSAARTRLISEETDVRFGFTVAHLGAALALVFALWRLAQQQLPALPRYRVHVAALLVLIALGMVAETFTYTMGGGADVSFHVAHVTWWHLVPVTLALACLVTILLTYANHRDAVYRPTLIGGALFIVGVAGWFILRDHPVVSPVSLACGYLALVPAILQLSRELTTDRVETTADVFA